MVVNPDAKTGPHHHGDLETVLYIVRGRARMRWGDHLEFSDEAGPGDFIYVPPYVPHQEINAGQDEPCEAVVVRSGQDPIVVNLELPTPEPASAGLFDRPFHPERQKQYTTFSLAAYERLPSNPRGHHGLLGPTRGGSPDLPY